MDTKCKSKYIVVVGGIISGVGKGVATASIGKILQSKGYTCTAVKIDPYINCDAGTLRPTEHGEVWVTEDGGEIDQDLGNYERFLGIEIPKKNNITTGQVYRTVIEKERRGEYLGKTVQFIPHIPEEIINRIVSASCDEEHPDGYDFVLIEIGGTVGDYENMPFLFAMRDLEIKIGKANIIYILVSYLPVPSHINEMKTKPTQHAIRMLAEHGIFPDFVLCRGPYPLDDVRKQKIETYANISKDFIISAPDVKTIYQVPINFEKENLGNKILQKLNMPAKNFDLVEWNKLVDKILNPTRKVKVAMVGKYVDIGAFTLTDSYISVNQALEHASATLNASVEISWVDSKQLETNDEEKINNALSQYDGIVIPGGFGASGVEGKINAIKFARLNNVPFLGLCYGLQLAVIEYARNVCNMRGANTTENDPQTPYPVIDILDEQKSIIASKNYGATMRLGAYVACMKPSKILSLYKSTGRMDKDMVRIGQMPRSERTGLCEGDMVLERHRHRYEVNPKYVHELESRGLVFPGYHLTMNGTKLMEFIELPNHRFFAATQAHPEFKSYLDDPAPLFLGFIQACLKK